MFLLRSCPTSFRNGSRPTWAVYIVTSNHECSSSHPCSLQKLTQWWIWSVTEMQAFWFVVLCLFQSSSDWSFCLWSWRRSVWALIRLLLVSAMLRHLLCRVSGGHGIVSFLACLKDFLVLGLLSLCHKVELCTPTALDCRICADFQDILRLKRCSMLQLCPHRFSGASAARIGVCYLSASTFKVFEDITAIYIVVQITHRLGKSV